MPGTRVIDGTASPMQVKRATTELRGRVARSDFEGEPGSRAYRSSKLFEAVIDRLLGDRVRADGACGVDLRCALTDIEWRGAGGEKVSYPFRRAAEVVVRVREEGDHLT